MFQVVMAAVAVAASIAAKAIGDAIAAGHQASAEEILKKAVLNYGPDVLPELKKLVPEQLVNTMYDNIKEDPELREVQKGVLSRLQRIYSEEGNTAEDEFAYQKALRDAQQHTASQRGAILQNLQARGVNSPNLEASMQMQAAQNDDQNLYMANLQQAADARKRALASLSDSASLAGNIRSQDYKVASDRAAAQDDINKFNANMRWAAQNANNQQEMDKWKAKEQQRQNRYAMAQDQANAKNGQAAQARQSGQQWAGTAAAVGSAVGGAYTDYEKYLESLKKNGGSNGQ